MTIEALINSMSMPISMALSFPWTQHPPSLELSWLAVLHGDALTAQRKESQCIASLLKVKVKFVVDTREHLQLHLGHLADAFIQSDLQRVHLLKETAIYRCGT